MQSKKFDFIDSLRGMAFLGVFACHAVGYLPGLPAWLRGLLNQGGIGVQLFFLVSSLTLFLSLDSRKATETTPTLNFFIRRFFRIVPLFYVGVLFYSLFFSGNSFDSRVPDRLTVGSIVSTVTFTNGWSPWWINQVVPGGWSIAVEMNFYLLVPILHRWLKSLTVSMLAVIGTYLLGVVASHVVRGMLDRVLQAQDQPMLEGFLQYWLPAQMYRFFMGFTLYFLVRHLLGAPQETDHPHRRRGLSIALLLLSVVSLFAAYVKLSPPLLAKPLCTLGLLLFALSLGVHSHRVFVNRGMCAIGKVSFSAYISHFSILYVVHWTAQSAGLPIDRMPWAVWALGFSLLALAATVAVSAGLYLLIEIPGQKLGQRLIKALESRRRIPLSTTDVPSS